MAKAKCISLSEELFDAVGRVTFIKNIPGNAVIIFAIEEWIKRNEPEVYQEYRDNIKKKP